MPEILIVGAGMTGLTAAAALEQAGHEVLVVEQGRAAGGRLASRRIGAATFDHGAQFITARDPRFAAAVDRWLQAGVVQEWYRGSAGRPSGHARWRGTPDMAAIPEFLARSVQVRLKHRLVRVQREAEGWIAEFSSRERVRAGAVLLTPPVPQSLALLDASEIHLPPSIRARLERIRYARCLATMAVLDEPARIPPPGGVAPAESPLAWIADNQMKGVSASPAVTLHATADFSLEHWERDRRETGREVLLAAQEWLGSNVVEFRVHAWRYARAISEERDGFVILHRSPPLLIAGDAFVAPRVEGAALSGWAAADALQAEIGHTL